MSRFMADNDHPDQLVLSLYGMIAIGMTPGTYISGEAISVVPVNGAYYRSMYMPPNSGANASYLETLRQMLVHERRGADGAPVGLDLAFSTPRAWLASGKTISRPGAHELRPGFFLDRAHRLAHRGRGHGSAERAPPPSLTAAGRRASPQRLARRVEPWIGNDRPRRATRRDRPERDRYAVSAAGRSARRYSTV